MKLATTQSAKLLKGILAAAALYLVLFFPTAATPLSPGYTAEPPGLA